MGNLQKVNLGVIPDGAGGDDARTAFNRHNSNVDVLSAQATLTSAPTITAAVALTAAHIGKRVNIALASAGTVNVPPANAAVADSVVLLRNIGATLVTLAVAATSGDTLAISKLNPGESVVLDTDGIHAWSVLVRGRSNADNESVVGNLSVGGGLSALGASAFGSAGQVTISDVGDVAIKGALTLPTKALGVASGGTGGKTAADARLNLGVGRTLIKSVTLNAAAGLVLTDADLGTFDSITVLCIGVVFTTPTGELRWQAAPKSDGTGGGYSAYHNTLSYSYINADGSHGITESSARGQTYGRLIYPPSGAAVNVNASGEFTFSNMQGLGSLGPWQQGRTASFDGGVLSGQAATFLQAAVGVIKYLNLFASSGTVSGKFIIYGNNS
jgi:hypothetical protein